MSGDWSEADSYDTLYVPFVWVPDGAPEPTKWLAQHPDAFWVPATLMRGQVSTDGAEPGSNDPSGGSSSPDLAGDPDSPQMHGWGAAADRHWPLESGASADFHYGREDPVAAYVRISDVFDRLGLGHSFGRVSESGRAATPPSSSDAAKPTASVADAAMSPAASFLSRLIHELDPVSTAKAEVVWGHGDRHVSDPAGARLEILQNLPPASQIGGPFFGITPNYIYRAFPLPNGDLNIGTYYPR